jgi:hypothetical protein
MQANKGNPGSKWPSTIAKVKAQQQGNKKRSLDAFVDDLFERDPPKMADVYVFFNPGSLALSDMFLVVSCRQ